MTDFLWTDDVPDNAVREELDRLHPERKQLRPKDVASARQAFAVLEEIWAPTIERARQLPPSLLDERVDGEYSFIETFRHLLFAWHAWLARSVLLLPAQFPEWAIPPDLPADAPARVRWAAGVGWTATETGPDLDTVLATRADGFARVRDYLSRASDDDLTALVDGPLWDPSRKVSRLFGMTIVLRDEWWHSRYVARDLGVLEHR